MTDIVVRMENDKIVYACLRARAGVCMSLSVYVCACACVCAS